MAKKQNADPLTDKQMKMIHLLLKGTQEEVARFVMEELSDEELDTVILPVLRGGADVIRDLSDLDDPKVKKHLAHLERLFTIH